MKKLITVLFLIYVTSSRATYADRCIKDEVKINRATCAKMEYQLHSKRLKNALDKLMGMKSINKQGLIKQQNSWLKYRDRACPKTGTEGFWHSCIAKLTKLRANKMERKAKKK